MQYRISDGGASEIIEADNLEAAVKAAKEWASEGSYDERVMVDVSIQGIDDDGDYTDEYELVEVEAGPEPEEPECADGEEHEWESPYKIVGGFKENPGVWSLGGTTMSFRSVCCYCGAHKHETSYGSQRNPGQCDQVTYDEADDETKDWLKHRHEDSGWIPQWLANYLDCPPTVRMTEEEATDYVADHTDEDELDDDDLEHAFAAIFGRRARNEDRAEGLWSHLYAASKAL